MNTQLLKLSDITTDAGTQIRARIDAETVDQYAAEWVDGAKFPAVAVFHDGNQYILADGFHRVMAASRNGFNDIEADVHKGTKSDALKFALAANSKHGLKRSNLDKRRSVELALAEWPKLSDRELAKICAVGNDLVGDVRKNQLSDSDSSTRIGSDGKERKLPTKKPAEPSPAPQASEPTSRPEPEQPAALKGIDVSKLDGAKVSETDRPEFFANDFESICDAVIADGNDKQLSAAILAAEVAIKKMRQEANRRRSQQ